MARRCPPENNTRKYTAPSLPPAIEALLEKCRKQVPAATNSKLTLPQRRNNEIPHNASNKRPASSPLMSPPASHNNRMLSPAHSIDNPLTLNNHNFPPISSTFIPAKRPLKSSSPQPAFHIKLTNKFERLPNPEEIPISPTYSDISSASIRSPTPKKQQRKASPRERTISPIQPQREEPIPDTQPLLEELEIARNLTIPDTPIPSPTHSLTLHPLISNSNTIAGLPRSTTHLLSEFITAFRWSSLPNVVNPPLSPKFDTNFNFATMFSLLPGLTIPDSLTYNIIKNNAPADALIIPPKAFDDPNFTPQPLGAANFIIFVFNFKTYLCTFFLDIKRATFTCFPHRAPDNRKNKCKEAEKSILSMLNKWWPGALPQLRRRNAPHRTQSPAEADKGLYTIKFALSLLESPTTNQLVFSPQTIGDLRSDIAKRAIALHIKKLLPTSSPTATADTNAPDNSNSSPPPPLSVAATQPSNIQPIEIHTTQPARTQHQYNINQRNNTNGPSPLPSWFDTSLTPQELYHKIVTNIFPSKITTIPEPAQLSRRKFPQMCAAKLRRTYKTHPRKAVRHIIPDAITDQNPTSLLLQTHFNNIFTLSTSNPTPIEYFITRYNIKFTQTPIGITQPFEVDEITDYLNGRPNTSPGHENISFSEWRKLNPHILAGLFNSIAQHRQVPNNWQSFRTVMIPKPQKADYTKVEAWRPIALLPTSYKILSGVLSKRLSPWLARHHISPAQKALAHAEGTMEHAYVTQTILDDANRRKKPLAMVWLDIADAFGSVRHDALFDLLHHIGLDNDSVELIKALYTNNSTFYSCGDATTDMISVTKGVRQGCPLSMSLFTVYIELLIRPLLAILDGYSCEDCEPVKVLAYADDLCLVATNAVCMQKALDLLSNTAPLIGFHFRATKCSALTYNCSADSPFSVHNCPINNPENTVTYLGVPAGLRNDQSCADILDKLAKDYEEISASELLPTQKFDALKKFLLPRLAYPLRTRDVQVKLLQNTFEGERNPEQRRNPGLNEKIKTITRQIFRLPQSAANSYLHSLVPTGGCGLPDLREDYAILAVVHVFKLLNSEDENVSKIAFADLKYCTRSHLPAGVPVTRDDMINYINSSSSTSGGRFSAWTKTRRSIRTLAHLNAKFSFVNAESRQIQLSFKSAYADAAVTLGPNSTKTITKALRLATASYHTKKLLSCESQGKVPAVACKSPLSSKWIFSDQIQAADFQFVHKARLQLLPTINNLAKYERNNKFTPHCRRCGQEWESQMHALNLCPPNLGSIRARHNNILKHVKEAIAAHNPSLDILLDQPYPGAGTALRVDLVVTNKQRKTIDLIDIKCPHENPESFDNARKKNEEKYTDHCNAIKQLHPTFTVRLSTFCIGSLGSWDDNNVPILRRLGFTFREIKEVAKNTTLAAIHGSRLTWILHTTGRS